MIRENLNDESQFNLGDKVVCLTPERYGWTKDKIGIVEEVLSYPSGKGVRFEDGTPVHSWPEGTLALYLPPIIDLEMYSAVKKWKAFFGENND